MVRKIKKSTARKTPVRKVKSKKARTLSARNVKAQLGGWLDKLPAQDWLEFANSQRTRLVKEVSQLTNEILKRINETTILSNRNEIVNEAKDHLDSIVNRINQSDLISKALGAAKDTKNEIFSFLNIPSQKELASLQRRLNQLEQKVSKVKPRRARA